MLNKRKFFQLSLVFLGILIIFFTYFSSFKIKKTSEKEQETEIVNEEFKEGMSFEGSFYINQDQEKLHTAFELYH